MRKLKHIVVILLTVTFTSGTTSCCCKKKGAITAPTVAVVDYSSEGYTQATVLSYMVDGCKWVLQLGDEKKLEPQNLAPEFQKDQLKVWIKYQAVKGGMSTCMAGTVVTISDIKERQ